MSATNMSHRRILSLWFPRLGAERILRAGRGDVPGPLVVVDEVSNTQVISSLNTEAEALGIQTGQPLRDAYSVCDVLLVRSRNVSQEKTFLAALRRWAGKFSPWINDEGDDGLVLDLTGCAHLFGGEGALMQRVENDCADMGISVRLGLADTRGAAWALARYAGVAVGSSRMGDAVGTEARATRARAVKRRHWTRGGSAPQLQAREWGNQRIALPGEAHQALAALPIAALRLEATAVTQLNRLGLRQIGDLLAQPRAGLARRFGRGLVLRLDQALGSAPEPVSPAREEDHFAVRLSLPEPIGLLEDMKAGMQRLLLQLCSKLEARGKGARQLRLEAYRIDRGVQAIELGLARPSHIPDRISALLEMKLEQIEAGFGIDMLRLEALQVEPVYARTRAGHAQAGEIARARQQDSGTALIDLIGRLGARLGLEAITRRHPADSHIPEKTAKVLAAAWSEPAKDWPYAPRPRPVLLWPPELVMAPARPEVPKQFRWRGQTWRQAEAQGPERIAPEWWLDDRNWRSGVRDYWVVITDTGARLWLYFAHGGTMSSGWFCQGAFA